MTRRLRWLALGLAIGLGAAGAYVAVVLAGGRWAAVGAALGAVTGSFAPSVHDALIGRGEKREALRANVERPVPQSPARLLDPRRELVEFVGREDELKALQAWCGEKDGGRLRLVTGPGGVGKTRLSVELADRMRKAGWRAERVAGGQEAKVIPALGDGRRRRTLLVVDYAETRIGLNQMLSDLAGRSGDEVRVLLLARYAGDWWDRLGIEDPAAWDQVQAAKQAVIDLAPAVSAELSDAEVAARAARAFAAELNRPERTVDLGGEAGRRRVLDLHAAALVAVLGQANGLPVEVKADDVLSELLRHEQHFWYYSAQVAGLADGRAGLTQQQIRQLIAAACLLGAATQDEAHALPARVPGLTPSAAIADWLRALYPPGTGEAEWIGSLQPDRLAELHAIREITASPGLAQMCLTDLDARQALRAISLLARASSDYPEAEELLRHALPPVADLIAAMDAPIEALTVIFDAIPYPTVVLAPAAVSICQRTISRLPDDADPAIRASWLRNLGIRLSALGHPADALPPEQEAIAIYRTLARANPDRYRPDLAASMANLGVTLWGLGHPIDALPVTEEAVAIRRELAAENPERYRRDLAASLINFGVILSELGSVNALPVTEEAAAVYRELAIEISDSYLPDLADSLANLGVVLGALGFSAEALSPAEEATAIRRGLAASSPDRYLPDLATSLNNLGVRYSRLSRPSDALPVTEEATAIRRELVAGNPDRYLPDLAASLANLADRLSEDGRPADALPNIVEAVAIFRGLAASSPDRHRPDLAGSLDILGATFSELGHPADALPPTEEAVAAYRDLVAAMPDRYRPDLATSLTRLAAVHDQLGQVAEAESARAEAARVEDVRS